MDARESRCTIGLLLLGIAPVLVAATGATMGMILFGAGLLIATSTAFA